MKLTILGTGTFFVNKNSSASAYLLEIQHKKILIDCGPGTLMRLSQIGIRLEDIDYIFITHFHADHTSDLFPLFMNLRLDDLFSKNKPKKFPKIIGPIGIEDFMKKLSTNFQLPALNGWNKIKFVDIKMSQTFDGIKIESFKVKHIAFKLASQAYAYRFSFNKKVIVFSGDSADCIGIRNACKNADIFICDTSYPKGENSSAHMNTHEIGTITSKSKVKKIISSHFYPHYNKINLTKEIKEKFSGDVIKGKDLMTISF